MKAFVAKNWKKLATLAALAAASYSGGPAGGEALKALGGAVGW